VCVRCPQAPRARSPVRIAKAKGCRVGTPQAARKSAIGWSRSDFRRRHRLLRAKTVGTRSFRSLCPRDRRVLRHMSPARSSTRVLAGSISRRHRAVAARFRNPTPATGSPARRQFIPSGGQAVRAIEGSPDLIIPAGSRGLRGTGSLASETAASCTGADVGDWLENARRPCLRLFAGENFGKQLVKYADAAASHGAPIPAKSSKAVLHSTSCQPWRLPCRVHQVWKAGGTGRPRIHRSASFPLPDRVKFASGQGDRDHRAESMWRNHQVCRTRKIPCRVWAMRLAVCRCRGQRRSLTLAVGDAVSTFPRSR